MVNSIWAQVVNSSRAPKQSKEMANLSTSDLCSSELSIVHAMQKLGFGHFEAVRVVAGEIALDPWPKMVQSVKFGNEEHCAVSSQGGFQLKKPVVQFIERVRSIGSREGLSRGSGWNRVST